MASLSRLILRVSPSMYGPTCSFYKHTFNLPLHLSTESTAKFKVNESTDFLVTCDGWGDEEDAPVERSAGAEDPAGTAIERGVWMQFDVESVQVSVQPQQGCRLRVCVAGGSKVVIIIIVIFIVTLILIVASVMILARSLASFIAQSGRYVGNRPSPQPASVLARLDQGLYFLKLPSIPFRLGRPATSPLFLSHMCAHRFHVAHHRRRIVS